MIQGSSMPRRLPPHCCEDVDRHGNIRVYFRAKDHLKIRLRGLAWSPEFMADYAAAKQSVSPQRRRRGRANEISPNSWRWLCTKYFASFQYPPTNYETILRQRLEATFDEPTKPGSNLYFRDMPLSMFGRKAIRTLRDRKKDIPEGANNRLKAIRNVFTWANEEFDDFKYGNPARAVEKLHRPTDGYYTWTKEDVLKFQSVHPSGSKPRLALALGLWAGGPRKLDLVRLGPQMFRDGILKYQPQKNRKTTGKWVEMPILPVLQKELDAAPKDHLTYLVTAFGKPFSANGFGNRFKDWCRQADLPQCTCHGMRKAGATIAAENGATDAQLMALFGWETARMAAHYRKKAEQKKLAADAIGLINFENK